VEIRFPILRNKLFDKWVLEILLPAEAQTRAGWSPLSFLFDPGSQLTSVPVALAEELSIPFVKSHPVAVRSTTGSGIGWLSPMTFSFPALSALEFQCLCFFNPTLQRPLLSLADVLDHFTFRAVRPSTLHPLGSFIMRLHKSHKGRPRTESPPEASGKPKGC
jgi:hypothetical protein